MKLTPVQVRVAFYAVVAVAALALFFLWLRGREDKLATQQSAEQGVRTDKAASAISQEAGKIITETRVVEVRVVEARGDYQRGYEDAKRNDPNVRDWADDPVPQRLRDLARQRRESRERSGCAGAGCPDHDRTPGN